MSLAGALVGAMSWALALVGTEGARPVVNVALEPELEAEATEALLLSCSSVFASQGPEACQLEGPADVRTEVEWKTNETGLQVSIELIRQGDGSRVIRVLSFTDTEDTAARWQAVGLVIAALASAELATREVEVPQETPPPPPPLEPPPPSHQTHLVMEIGGLVRQETAKHFLSGGGEMRLSLDVGSRWEPTLSVGMLAGRLPVNQFTVRPSFGMGLRIVESPFSFLLRLEGLAMATRWSASDPLGADSDTEWHVRYGVSLGPSFRIPFSRSLGMFVEGRATAVFPPVEIAVRNQVVGTSSMWGGEGALGIWARF